MDDATGSNARAGLGARKTVLRYHDPRTLPLPEMYPRQLFNYGSSSAVSAHLTYPPRREGLVPTQTQSARTSPRDGVPWGSSMMAPEPLYAHAPPPVLRGPYHVPVIGISQQQQQHQQEKQQQQSTTISLPPPLTRNHNIPGSGDYRHPQIAPFANAGPPAVQHWTSISVPSQESIASTPIVHSSSAVGMGMGVVNRHQLQQQHQQQQQQSVPNHWMRVVGAPERTGISSTDLGSPVLRGRRM